MPSSTDQTLQVSPIPAFNDNYIWMIDNRKEAVIVDPGEAGPVLAALQKRSLKLCAIVLTHRHEDHIGGVSRLLQEYSVPVYGPRFDPIESVTQPVQEGDIVTIFELDNLQLSVLDVPGHTKGHIAYYAKNEKWLFCGDMLFGAGCGRMFEGTPEQMWTSLSKLAALPDDVEVFAGHEYTLSNLKFAREIEPDSKALAARIKEDVAKRNRRQPTLPSTIGLEKATNPFLRADREEVMKRLESLGKLKDHDPVNAFAAMREWKNKYV